MFFNSFWLTINFTLMNFLILFKNRAFSVGFCQNYDEIALMTERLKFEFLLVDINLDLF